MGRIRLTHASFCARDEFWDVAAAVVEAFCAKANDGANSRGAGISAIHKNKPANMRFME